MAFGRIIKVPTDQQGYDAVNEKLRERMGESGPDGQQFHAAGATGDGGWRIIEVWESREAAQSFDEGDLRPAIQAVMGDGAPQPEIEEFDVYAKMP